MTTLTILTIEKGRIEGIADFRSLLVPFAQEGLKGRSERLTNSSCIQPEEEDLSVVKELLDETTRKMIEARTERDRVSKISTRTKTATEGVSTEESAAERRLEDAIAKYDGRHDKYEKARRAAETRLAAENKEMECVLAAFKTAVSREVLTILVSGAVGIGSRASEDGRIVTPGTVVEAMQRYEDAQVRPTIAEAIAGMGAIIKTLETKLHDEKPQLAWPRLVADLRQWHHKMGNQVGCLTAPIVGRWITETVETALASAGTRSALAVLLELTFGDGRIANNADATWTDLFKALENNEVQQEAVVNLAKLTRAPTKIRGGARLATIQNDGYCYAFQKGECPRGAMCHYLHEMKPQQPTAAAAKK